MTHLFLRLPRSKAGSSGQDDSTDQQEPHVRRLRPAGTRRRRRAALSDAALRDLDTSVRRYVAALLTDRHDIDDVVQETMTRVLTAQRRLDGSSVTGYAIVVARNLVRDQQRAAARHRRNERDLYDDRAARRPDEVVLDAEEHRALRAAFAELTPAHRDLLLAHDVEGRPLGDLAGSGGTAALAARLSRTRAALRVDYLIARRRDPLPTARCRPVLLALSSGDKRRQDILRAGSHLLSCPACAELAPALVQRRRSLAAVVPWLATGWWARPGRFLSRAHTRSALALLASRLPLLRFWYCITRRPLTPRLPT